jgi:hypothetical protein
MNRLDACCTVGVGHGDVAFCADAICAVHGHDQRRTAIACKRYGRESDHRQDGRTRDERRLFCHVPTVHELLRGWQSFWCLQTNSAGVVDGGHTLSVHRRSFGVYDCIFSSDNKCPRRFVMRKQACCWNGANHFWKGRTRLRPWPFMGHTDLATHERGPRT